MKIIVTPEEMRSNATSLRSEKANFEQCISSMRTIVNSMSGVFEGEAAAAYVSNFESYNGQFTAFWRTSGKLCTKAGYRGQYYGGN